jgi:3-hydroxyacyl-CoA dehydrogenase
MTDTKPIRRIAIIGTGVIGASWSSLFLAKGLQVVATDIAPNAEAALRKFVETAWPALKRLGLSPGASQSNLKFTADLAQALAGADLVQENGPERIDFKQKLYGQFEEMLPPDVIIASSSSGLTMSEIQKGAASHPERCVIAHPFNPPHLIPLTEIVGGAKTSEATIRLSCRHRWGSTTESACLRKWLALRANAINLRIVLCPPLDAPRLPTFN